MAIRILTPEEERAENLSKIAQFKLTDDTYMNAFFNEQPELVQFVLRIIMGKDKLIVKSARTQKPLKSIQGRSITLDVDAIDEDGTEFDIEVQQENSGAIPKRARYHSSMMDSNALKPNDNFDKLPETYVIFITAKDYWKKGLPIYTVDRYIKEMDMTPFDDDEHIIYVNGEYNSDSPIGKLMHDFKCTKPSEMYYPNLAERASYLKETKGGYDSMCKIMEEIADRKAESRAAIIAIKLLSKNTMSHEEIADTTGLSLEDIKELAKQYIDQE